MNGWFLTEFFTQLNESMNQLFRDFLIPESLDAIGIHTPMLVVLAMLCLMGAFMWNFAEAIIFWLREQRWPTKHIKQGLLILIFAGLGKALSPLASVSDTGVPNPYHSGLGISYTSIVAPMNDAAIKQSIKAIESVDLVGQWNAALREMRAKRRLFIIQEISKTDPELAATLADRDKYAAGSMGNSADKSWWDQTVSRLKGMYEVGKTVITAMTNPEAWTELGINFLKSMVVPAATLMVDGVIYLSTLMVGIALAKVFLIYIVSLKLATLLACAFLPTIVALMYFKPLRGLGVRAVKNILALAIMANLMGGVLQTVLSDANIESMVAISLSDQISGTNRPVTTGDILSLKLQTSMETVLGPSLSGEDPTFFYGVDMEDMINSVKAIFRVLFILGLIGHILSMLYDLISGTMSGSWDPWRGMEGVDTR